MKGQMLSPGEAGVAAILGYVVVFIGLILLMVVVLVMGKIMISRRRAAQLKESSKLAIAPAPAAAPAALPAAPGSAGEIKLHTVPDKEAAMVMAIVADKLQKPLNELRFKSIKEVK